jgi:hypothetical protein
MVQDVRVLIVRATKKLLDLVGPPDLSDDDHDTTQLGPWYATRLPWRPRVALLVSEPTLLPVLMPLTPARSWSSRIAEQVATVLAALRVPTPFVEAELEHMADRRLGPTASRSVVGVMNEFVHLADVYRAGRGEPDLLDLSLRLSRTPCSPLYKRHVSPDRELAAVVLSPPAEDPPAPAHG